MRYQVLTAVIEAAGSSEDLVTSVALHDHTVSRPGTPQLGVAVAIKWNTHDNLHHPVGTG